MRLARILRLIDQHMVDPGIQFIEHPARFRALEQGQGLADEIVEIEEPTRRFLLAVSLEYGGRDLDQRARALKGCGGLAFLAKRIETSLLGE